LLNFDSQKAMPGTSSVSTQLIKPSFIHKKPAFQGTNTTIDNNPMVMLLFFRIIASALQLKKQIKVEP